MNNVKTISHPLYLHKLSFLRDERVRCKQFRELVNELSLLLAMFATQSLDLMTTKTLSSPLGEYTGIKLKDTMGLFPIMRAGNGMVDGILY
jgi:uracil phosphoribosyltransferase